MKLKRQEHTLLNYVMPIIITKRDDFFFEIFIKFFLIGNIVYILFALTLYFFLTSFFVLFSGWSKCDMSVLDKQFIISQIAFILCFGCYICNYIYSFQSNHILNYFCCSWYLITYNFDQTVSIITEKILTCRHLAESTFILV